MPRQPRHYLAGFPYHICQRGNNRKICFFDLEGFHTYLRLWCIYAPRYGAQVHAWCLMNNHIHLLITPESVQSISHAMCLVGSQYAQYVNKKHERTGTLWEGRHHASLIQSQRYLLTCMRYIELNPVRAGIVQHPGDYPWSSYHANASGRAGWLTPHPEYLALGSGPDRRAANYRTILQEPLADVDLKRLRECLKFSNPIADDDFRQQITADHGVKFAKKRGRPKKEMDKKGAAKKGDGGDFPW